MSKDELKFESFRGNPTEFIDSPWLSSEDLLGSGKESVEMEIEDVAASYNVKAQNGKVEAKVMSLKFTKAKKRMWLNATNIRTLTSAFGGVDNWVGKKVNVYIEHGVRNPAGGSPVKGLRIKVPTSIVKKQA